MITLNFSPPPVAHDAATQLAQVYLAYAVDPAATRARLDELHAATQRPIERHWRVDEVTYADGGAALMTRRRTALVRDAVIAVAVALALVGAWKLIPLAARVVAVP
jgi:hypothetical protein